MYNTIQDMIGVTMKDVRGETGDSTLSFFAEDGREFQFFHQQDCCEHVYIEDIIGDLQDLVGSPIRMAEESGDDASHSENVSESGTWTFYKFATAKGYVTVRWLGTSNGYYSESVDFTVYHPKTVTDTDNDE
jgi:hypothetical protein